MTQRTLQQAALAHEARVALARKNLEASNANLERGRVRGLEKAFQQAVRRFLKEGENPGPMRLDLERWPFLDGKAEGGIPREVRKAILREDQLCLWCRSNPASTIDHVHPLGRGGSNHALNLIGSCLGCNNAKANFLPKEIGWTLRLPLRAFDMAGGHAGLGCRTH